MVQSYWQIGRLIVEPEQQGESRAVYGKQQLQQLSQQLAERLGKGFDVTNLRNMRSFYLAFPIRDAVRVELSWSTRALERQVHKLYYERLLASKDKALVKQVLCFFVISVIFSITF
jgi:hypothetical protein